MAPSTVLVTGLGGLIGGAVRAHLGDRYAFRGLGRRPGPPGVPWHAADIADLDAIAPAFEGVQAVVHLAAVVGGGASFEEYVRGNVVGTYNVFEAARRAGVARVVYASSGAVISGVERDEPYRALAEGRAADIAPPPVLTHESPLRPSGIYGCTKVWGEALARHYVDAHGMSAICLRIGAVNAEDRPRAPRERAVWCSRRDVARMIGACLDAPRELTFDIFYVTSRNRRGYRDLSHARDVLGWEPLDSADDHA
ncbi:MAG TPA: NAD(P)-dependent oxidoreductase [Candidatus Tectomicrobia bacterium]|nr:NAD(P)-dependent oxidoreductase [Candidatus Tectomicrobia bacterium]